MPSPVTTTDLREVDPLVWRACVGYTVNIPDVGSRVYYFPQGHAEQASSDPDLSSIHISQPYLRSRVLFVKYLADPVTDQVYLKIGLDPRPHSLEDSPPPETAEMAAAGEERSSTQSFAKILTQSDANNGGGFSVPRFCAEAIFPELDLTSEMPVQNLEVRDLVGNEWKFRHIYRGTPRRHLLTTGWSRFVNEKKLVAGDSVVFIRDRNGGVFVGIRRRLCKFVKKAAQVEVKGFVRNGRGRVAAGAVVEAVRAAVDGDRVYDVDYYPGKGSPEFVVPVELVEQTKMDAYMVGTKVKMLVQTEDARRMTWFYGIIDRLNMMGSGPWAYSPWRILEV